MPRSGFPSVVRSQEDREDRVVAIAGTRVSTVEMPCFWITKPATLLHTPHICKEVEVPGCLASLASPHFWCKWCLPCVSGYCNVISVLERSDRICQMQVDLDCDLDFCSTWEIEKLWTAMQVPFLELALLYLQGFSNMPVLPDSFLGGSAPRLRYFFLRGIPFPGLPTLTSSNFGFYVFPIPGIFHPQFCNTYQTDGSVLVY